MDGDSNTSTPKLLASLRSLRTYKPVTSERLLYWFLGGAILLFAVYVYGVAAFPPFNYAKDVLVVMVGAATLLDISLRPLRRRVSRIDLSVFLFAVYLLFQLFYTAGRIASLPVAYLGFRLDFMPIIFYFGFRRLRNERYRRSVYALLMVTMIAAVMWTLGEISLVVSGFVPQDFFWALAGANQLRVGQAVGFIPRVYGIMGTPQITGVYHLILLGVLLNWPKGKMGLPWLNCLDRTWVRGGLLLLTVVAIFVSTSKTAWLILPVVVGLQVVSQRRINTRTIITIAMLVVVSALFSYFLVFQDATQRERVVDQLILGTIVLKQQQVEVWTEDVLRDSPVIGYGYAYFDNSGGIFDASKLTNLNKYVTGDAYFIEIFRMFGGSGVLLLVVVLGLLPLRILFSRRSLPEQKGAAMGVLVIALAFAHYPPLTHPLMGMAIWCLMAAMANGHPMQEHGRDTANMPVPRMSVRQTVLARQAIGSG